MALQTRAIVGLSCLLVLLPNAWGESLTLKDLPTTPSANPKGQLLFQSFPATPDFKLTTINPFLNGSSYGAPNCIGNAGRTEYDVCNDHVSFFSGLALANRGTSGPLRFLGVTDRGPNHACGDFKDNKKALPSKTCSADNPEGCNDWGRAWYGMAGYRFNGVALDQASAAGSGAAAGQGFPIPRFSPSFFSFEVDKAAGSLKVVGHCYLKDQAGNPITGLPNFAGYDNVPYGPVCVPPATPGTDWPTSSPYYNAAGMDVEDIQVIPGTSNPRLCMVSDEYSPSLMVFNCEFDNPKCGEVHARYVPASMASGATRYQNFAAYPIKGVLPDVLLNRRINKGLENVAVSPDGKIAMAMLQAAMGDEKDAIYKNSFVLTAVKLDISNPVDPQLLGVYLYVADAPASFQTGNKATKQYASGFSWANTVIEEKGLDPSYPLLLVDERSGGDQVRPFLADFSSATNVQNMYGGNFLKFDALTTTSGMTRDQVLAALAALGVTPAKKAMLFDTGCVSCTPAVFNIPGWTATTGKQEGIVDLNPCVVGIGDDNDFAIGGLGQSALNLVQLGTCMTDLFDQMNPPKNASLRILHINDNHARFDPATASFGPCTTPATCFGGFSRMATAVKEARAKAEAAGDDILVLHAGDQFTGTVWDSIYTSKNKHVAPQFLNALGVDAFVPGNHEFDYGPAVLSSFIDALNASVVSCNIDVSASPLLKDRIKPFIVKRLPVSRAKVAIIGITTPDTPVTSSPGPDLVFKDPLASLPSCVTAAKAAGAKIIIALTHIGADRDLDLAASAAAADVDLVVGGHSHSLFYSGTPPALLVNPATPESTVPIGPYPMAVSNNGQSIPVVSALWASRYLGSMSTLFSPSGALFNIQGSPILLGGASSTNPVADDAQTVAMLDALRAPITALNNQNVGRTSTYLTGPTGEPGTPDATLFNPVRMKETNLGTMFGNALLWYFKTKTSLLSSDYGTLPVVAIYNGGGIRASVPKGSITQGAIITMSPFGNWAVAKKANASVVLASLANGVSTWATSGPGGRFPQVAGLRYAFDSGRPAASRLQRAFLDDGRELGRQYTGEIVVLTNNFMGLAPGGDGYTALAAAPLLLDTSYPMDRLLADYVASKAVINPAVEGRITDCSQAPGSLMCPPQDLPLEGLAVKQSSTKPWIQAYPLSDGQCQCAYYSTAGDAGLAVDRKADTFILSERTRSPWFEVDLGKTLTVETVTIYAPTLPDGLVPPVTYSNTTVFNVRVTNTSSTAGSPVYTGPGTQRCGSLKGPPNPKRAQPSEASPSGSTLYCNRAGAGRMMVLPTGRYLTVEISTPMGQLSFAEIAIAVKASAT